MPGSRSARDGPARTSWPALAAPLTAIAAPTATAIAASATWRDLITSSIGAGQARPTFAAGRCLAQLRSGRLAGGALKRALSAARAARPVLLEAAGAR